ncbi:MAG TPA: glycosidase, partial [Clostridiales bacterium]|nr:glycosidase [Clostridiales bacterium]
MKLERYRANPILTASDFVPCDSELKVVLAFNPGVAKYDNQTVLLVRVAVAAAPRENCVGVPVY